MQHPMCRHAFEGVRKAVYARSEQGQARGAWAGGVWIDCMQAGHAGPSTLAPPTARVAKIGQARPK